LTKRHIYFVIISLVLLVLIGTETRAELYKFDDYKWEWKYIGGAAGYAPNADVMNQLSIAITNEDYGTWEVEDNQVLFIFNKTGTADFSLTDIYFDDGTLLALSSIYNDNDPLHNVDFETLAKPADLPEGNNAKPPFQTSVGFSTDVGNAPEGLDIDGEIVGIVFDLKSGSIDDIINAIYAGFDLRAGDDPTGTLRIGIHVSSIEDNAGNYSQSFILVPVPAAVILGLLGLGIAGIKLRKFA
jgi:hypothetical protein